MKYLIFGAKIQISHWMNTFEVHIFSMKIQIFTKTIFKDKNSYLAQDNL